MKTLISITCSIIAVMSLCSAIGKEQELTPTTKEILAEKAETYTDFSKAPRPSVSVPINLFLQPGLTPPFMVQVVNAEMTETDTRIPFPNWRETDKHILEGAGLLPVKEWKVVKRPDRFRRFIRVTLCNITRSQQELTMEVATAGEGNPVPGGKPTTVTQLGTDRIRGLSLTAGTMVIIDCPGAMSLKGPVVARSLTGNKLTWKGNVRPPKVTAVEVKIMDSSNAVLYQGRWPANFVRR
jgi:hypothetical protein